MLVTFDPNRCPACGAELVVLEWRQPSLFRHGGYGATRRTRVRRCLLDGWSLEFSVDEVRP
jgi:hypothetical protein